MRQATMIGLCVGVFLTAGVSLAGLVKPERDLIAAGVPQVGLNAGADQTPSRRSRGVVLDLSALPTAANSSISISLFEDVRVLAEIEAISTDGPDATILTGRLSGEAQSSFILARRGSVVAGEVRSPTRGDFEIRPLADGSHVVREIDYAGFKPCATGAEHAVGCPLCGASPSPSPVARGVIANTEVWIAVFYTDQARAGAGGQAQIDAAIDTAITQANQVYTRSLVPLTVRLAYRGLVNYTESNSASTDLSRFRSTSDGFMDEVHCIRDKYGADLCALLVNNFDACGIGYLMTTVNTGFASNGFTVTDRDCISNFSFAHELGHNMACHHDRANGSGAAYVYAYGFRTADSVYRTVMAYAPGTRVGYFSNPDVTFNGYQMGSALTSSTPTHNALVLTTTAPVVNQFRRVAADFDRSGTISPTDIFSYLNSYFAGNPGADVDGGGLAPTDIFAFLNLYFLAC